MIRAAALGALLLCCTGCGSQTAVVSSSSLHLSATSPHAPPRSMTLNTSPDGGFYVNPNRLAVATVATVDGASIAGLSSSVADAVHATSHLGNPVAIVFRVNNNGKASSDPAFGDMQIASDYAPTAASGKARGYYHPFLPVAMVVAGAEPEDNCAVHLDQGQSATVILVYPPMQPAQTILWGIYGGPTVTLHVGGRVPPLPESLRAEGCTPPPEVSA